MGSIFLMSRPSTLDSAAQSLILLAVRAFKEPKQVEIVFSCQAAGVTDQLSFEIQRIAWFRPDELPPELPKDQAQLIKRALADGATPQD